MTISSLHNNQLKHIKGFTTIRKCWKKLNINLKVKKL